ncbi:hypothetical protein ACTXT7_007648 [Hymenolepis weldensis]
MNSDLPPKQQAKTTKKDPKASKPKKDGGGKAKKKKWSKGKVRDKLNNASLFDKSTYDKFVKEIPQSRLITPSSVSERMKIRVSLARAGLQELVKQGVLRQISSHHAQQIYVRQDVWEYEQQQNWLIKEDRVTFILLEKSRLSTCDISGLKPISESEFPSLKPPVDEPPIDTICEAEVNAMIGDVNFYLIPDTESNAQDVFEGEVSVMIAEPSSRGKGLAAQALAGALFYVEHLFPHNVTGVVAKISLDNELSLRFFANKLGFVVRKRNTCFNEAELICPLSETGGSAIVQAAEKAIASLRKSGKEWIFRKFIRFGGVVYTMCELEHSLCGCHCLPLPVARLNGLSIMLQVVNTGFVAAQLFASDKPKVGLDKRMLDNWGKNEMEKGEGVGRGMGGKREASMPSEDNLDCEEQAKWDISEYSVLVKLYVFLQVQMSELEFRASERINVRDFRAY